MKFWKRSLEQEAARERLRRQQQIDREEAHRKKVLRIAALTLVVGTIGAFGTWSAIFGFPGGGTPERDPISQSPAQPVGQPLSSTPTPTEPEVDESFGTSIGLGCPAFPDPGSDRPSLQIRVVVWCAEDAVRGQAQIKAKVWIKNGGDEPLDISLPHWYLLVSGVKPERWSPPQIGTPSTRSPFRIRFRGVPVVAIPANEERAFDLLPENPNIGTFATHWNGFTLGGGETFKPQDASHGNLVFYVPARSQQVRGVVGVAYLIGRKPIAVCPPERWGPRVPLGNF